MNDWKLESNYKFLVDCIKRDIKTSKSLIKTFTEDAEKHKKNGFEYGEGQCAGLVIVHELRVKDLEHTLQIIGEELEDGPQRTSAEPLAR